MPARAKVHKTTATRVASKDTRDRRRYRRRGTNKERGYDWHWQQISMMQRQMVPVCEVCRQAAATEVDHIKPFVGPDDPLRTDWDNLQSICQECHHVKTAADRGRSMVR